MRLKSPNSIFNMGDTSIRVKQIVEVNKVILEQLNNFMKSNVVWNQNKEEQENFYRLFINEIVELEQDEEYSIFADFWRLRNYKTPDPNKKGLRGRTLTNSLLKLGLINEDRQLSDIGYAYLKNDVKQEDFIERLLGLSVDNLVYLRQLLKLRIYDSSNDNYFYNFRFALKFLSIYKNVNQQHFLTILESIRPIQSQNELLNIIDDYQDVYNNKIDFFIFYNRHFKNYFLREKNLDDIENKLNLNNWDNDYLISKFYNNKSHKTTELYLEFIRCLIEFKNNPTTLKLEQLIKISKEEKIKKAFCYGNKVFEFNKDDNLQMFLANNKNNPLLEKQNQQIYIQFVFSKLWDLIKEYSDMCKRLFESTGLISFENKLVNLNNHIVIDALLKVLGNKFVLCGSETYDMYEKTYNSIWFLDLSIKKIFNIDEEQYNQLISIIQKEIKIDIKNIETKISQIREEEFRQFIYNKFPKNKIIQILKFIEKRNDEQVYKLVSQNATIPTIYEYIITIAWFYISKNKDYLFSKSFGVSLDANKLPLIHRPANNGDIEIINKTYSLLIETTLLNPNNQKRAELESVIRHSVNFYSTYNNCQTIFIANKLDDNVLNIFRATQFIELNTTNKKRTTIKGLNIFSFTTSELIQLLEKDIFDLDILKIINENLNKNPVFINNKWREQIINQIFNK
ncbi:AlwI family type II restriction endonuclease [Mycoplasma mycoides]|uniref:AlwI family type II restriction endonuclease n=1 Tax=Mycoplasma mycoides TaxID=2102 RepID=UPI0001793EF0|nr:AlwI family type II restriction endonuclease [Mycoplasma mycoides]ADH21671.1 GCATC--recognizing Type II restriction modification system (MmyCIII) endonuclease subunit [synthetic Mycoplasma mycoides JCVI-syn1.0]ACU78720.1 GCATC--recognizing Type II restriction modification system (MmyCIII) endonuclease subunit [Mycoplasma mycoides subsp. capri str. GM12]ACU79551.1 GCATC--recognizing Type II restriction modification system (MmyCIII) endonuclease subunit [Mycoplasma mycoides subsp. capri str. GM